MVKLLLLAYLITITHMTILKTLATSLGTLYLSFFFRRLFFSTLLSFHPFYSSKSMNVVI